MTWMHQALEPSPSLIRNDCRHEATGALSNAFGPIELAAIRLSEIDSPRTLRSPTGVGRLIAALLFPTVNPILADPRLEALRRIAILLRNGRIIAADDEVEAALAAGVSRWQLAVLAGHLAHFQPDSGGHRIRRSKTTTVSL